MRLQTLHLFIPGIALAIVGFALIGPGATSPFDGAQIWGGPTAGARALSLRVSVTERLHGIDSPRNIGTIEVQASTDDGTTASVRGRTGPDGNADLELPLAAPLRGRIRATVLADGGKPLASGFLRRESSSWGTEPRVARLAGLAEGELSLRVAAARGVFAAPFPDELVVEARRAGTAVAGASVRVKVEGARLTLRASPEPADDGSQEDEVLGVTGGEGRFSLRVAPLSHVVEVAVEARGAGTSGSWHGNLPVVPGAMWLDPVALASRKLRIVSPAPRDAAYVNIATSGTRLWGATVPLRPDARGFASGEIDWPGAARTASPDDGVVWVTVASDARATGSGTVGWPVRVRDGLVPDVALPGDGESARSFGLDERRFAELLLLDGMPQAERRDEARRTRARLLAGAALMAAAMLEALLLFEAARSSERNLLALLEASRAIDPGAALRPHRAGAVMWLAIAIATVVLGFAAVGVFVLWKTGG
jgi:hypothetical protein